MLEEEGIVSLVSSSRFTVDMDLATGCVRRGTEEAEIRGASELGRGNRDSRPTCSHRNRSHQPQFPNLASSTLDPSHKLYEVALILLSLPPGPSRPYPVMCGAQRTTTVPTAIKSKRSRLAQLNALSSMSSTVLKHTRRMQWG